MSGGYLDDEGLKAGEHRVIIFNFKGPIDGAVCVDWNTILKDFKTDPEKFGENLLAVTIVGKPTPGAEAFKKKRPSSGPKNRKVIRRK